jgi:putative transposase
VVANDIAPTAVFFGKPNDNAHIERFNRTIQEECPILRLKDLNLWQQEVPKYLHYYNHERPHMALEWDTPMERLEKLGFATIL